MNQFISGLGDDLWQDIQQNQDSAKFLLVKHDTPLTPKDMKDLYQVDTSPQGSNHRPLEDDTLYCFEVFLQHCSGNKVGRAYGLFNVTRLTLRLVYIYLWFQIDDSHHFVWGKLLNSSYL